ncbi:MAG: hypothetical protein ABI432_00670 [Flavobacteriales bacterium]
MRTQRNNSNIAILLLLVFMTGQWGCVRWHRRPMTNASLPHIKVDRNQVFVVTDPSVGKRMWVVRHPILTNDSLIGTFTLYPEDRAANLLHAQKNRDLRDQRNRVLFHAAPGITMAPPDGTRFALPLNAFTQIESIDVDIGTTIVVTLLATVGVLAVVALIILATKSSCPFIYTESPDGYQLEGEIFSGSIYPQLQRHDRLPLHHLSPLNGEYHVCIANKALEIQSTDLLELLVVDHDPGTNVLFDREGRALTFNSPAAPITATDRKGDDVLDVLSSADDKAWQGDALNERPDADDGVELTFLKPGHTKSAKLMVRARNTFWADHLYGLFLDEFGTYTDEIQAMNKKKSTEELRQWSKDQNLPLGILVEQRPGQWVRIGQYELAGPIAWREDAVEIDLSAIEGDRVHLKLETGFLFWEIDQVALDAAPDQPISVRTLTPVSAVDQQQRDVLGRLLKEDGSCLVQPALDDRTDVVFSAPDPIPGKERSFFLHAAGHYEILREPKPHTPNMLYLRSFKEPNALSRYSRERWNDSKELEFSQPL